MPETGALSREATNSFWSLMHDTIAARISAGMPKAPRARFEVHDDFAWPLRAGQEKTIAAIAEVSAEQAKTVSAIAEVTGELQVSGQD